ncbi:MAG TPA: hypothetical protein VFZ20_32300, partial [Longimicrobium sp.]
DPAGHPHALWFAPERNGQGATVLLHRAWNGQAWGAAEVVYRSESGGGGPMASLAATFACDGALHVAYSTAAGLEHRRWTAGAGWGRPFLLAYAGLTPAWSRGSCPAALHLAWMAGAEGPRRGRSVNQLFVRTFHDGEWGQTTRLFAWPERYSHHPQLVTDGAGRLHALWLQDTDGSILPEAVYHATSCDGRRWTPARDVTPPGVAGARLWGMRAAVDGDGRPHLALRYSRPDRPRVGELATARWEGGAWSLPAPVPADGPLGEGDPLIVAGPARGILAAWRGGDGLYRYAVASAGAARAHPPRSP